MTKQEVEHFDAIGRPLKLGDPVAVPSGVTSLMIGRITGVGKKQIRVVDYSESARVTNWNGEDVKNMGKLRYPKDAVLIDGPEITMYLLKFANRE